MSQSNWLSLAILVALVSWVGCGGRSGGPNTVPVTGTVTLDGTPVEGASVSFGPQEATGRTAAGATDASGRFTLTTVEAGDGAMPGSYKVAISKTTGGAMKPTATTREEAEQQMREQLAAGTLGRPPEVRDELPVIYKSAETSGLTAEVTEGGDNDFKFDLSSSAK